MPLLRRVFGIEGAEAHASRFRCARRARRPATAARPTRATGCWAAAVLHHGGVRVPGVLPHLPGGPFTCATLHRGVAPAPVQRGGAVAAWCSRPCSRRRCVVLAQDGATASARWARCWALASRLNRTFRPVGGAATCLRCVARARSCHAVRRRVPRGDRPASSRSVGFPGRSARGAARCRDACPAHAISFPLLARTEKAGLPVASAAQEADEDAVGAEG